MAKRSLKNLAKTIKESEGSNADNSLVIDVTQTPLFSTVQEIKEIEEAAKVKGVKKMSNIYWLDPNELLPYPDEKIRLPLHSGLRKEQLKDTIVKDGVLDPAIVWEMNGKRIILAGHNRVEICKEEKKNLQTTSYWKSCVAKDLKPHYCKGVCLQHGIQQSEPPSHDIQERSSLRIRPLW